MERNSKKEFIIDVIYNLTVFLLVLAVYFLLVKFLLPFVIGAIIAFAVQKPAKMISDKAKLSQGTWSVVLALLLYSIVGTLFCFLVYRIILLAVDFTDYLPQFFDRIKQIFDNITQRYSYLFERLPNEIRIGSETLFNDTVQKFIVTVGSWVTKAISNFVKRIPLLFISGIVTLVASCYISKDFLRLKKFLKSFVGQRVAEKSVKIKNILVGSVFKILKGYFIIWIITCTELYLGFLILKINKPFLLAFIVAIVDLLPVLGTGTVLIPWAVISVLSNNFNLGIGLTVLYIIVVLLRNFLEPKIIGMQVGINSLFTLMAMFLGLKILGFWGLILFPIILIVTVKYYKGEMEEGLSV